MVIWTAAPAWGGFYFGPYYFSDALNITTFQARFGQDERTLLDGYGFKHLYYMRRGLEVTATTSGQLVSFTFYYQPSITLQTRVFASADAQTDTGLAPGNTWADVWSAQGPPQAQKVDEAGDRLYVLEYHLGADHDLDFFFHRKANDEPIFKVGLYSRH